MTGGVGIVPLRISGLTFFSGFAFEDAPEADVGGAVAVVECCNDLFIGPTVGSGCTEVVLDVVPVCTPPPATS